MDGRNGTSQRVSQCVLSILEAEGPQAVSMRRVAKEVGITAMAIYHHFPSREALLSAVVDSEFEHLVDFFVQSGRNGSFETQMVHIMDGYMNYALAHPRIFEYVFSSRRPRARQFPDDFRTRLSPAFNVVADAVTAGIEAGKLKRDDSGDRDGIVVPRTRLPHALPRRTLQPDGRRVSQTFSPFPSEVISWTCRVSAEMQRDFMVVSP